MRSRGQTESRRSHRTRARAVLVRCRPRRARRPSRASSPRTWCSWASRRPPSAAPPSRASTCSLRPPPGPHNPARRRSPPAPRSAWSTSRCLWTWRATQRPRRSLAAPGPCAPAPPPTRALPARCRPRGTPGQRGRRGSPCQVRLSSSRALPAVAARIAECGPTLLLPQASLPLPQSQREASWRRATWACSASPPRRRSPRTPWTWPASSHRCGAGCLNALVASVSQPQPLRHPQQAILKHGIGWH